MSTFQAVRYPDRWLRLVGIPLLTILSRHIGDPTPLYDLLRKQDYYFDLLAGLVVTTLVWEINRRLIRYFDRRYFWVQDTFRRFIIQSLVNLGLSAIILTMTIVLYNNVLMQRGPTYNIHFLFVIDLPLGLIFVVGINAVYAIINIVQTYEEQLRDLRRQLAEARNRPPQTEAGKTVKKNLVVSKGSAMVPLPTDEIAYIYKVNDYNFVKTFENQEYMVEHTLDQLSQMLSEAEFYRINRQMIANIEAIRQVQQKEQGGFVLRLTPQFADEVTVSKKKAAEFKAWIDR